MEDSAEKQTKHGRAQKNKNGPSGNLLRIGVFRIQIHFLKEIRVEMLPKFA